MDCFFGLLDQLGRVSPSDSIPVVTGALPIFCRPPRAQVWSALKIAPKRLFTEFLA